MDAGQETALRQYYAAHRPRAMMRRKVAHIRSIPAASVTRSPSSSLFEGGGETQALVPDMLGRVPIQPPVCGVQPGRMLCLRTSLGLKHVKSMLSQQQEQQQLDYQRTTTTTSTSTSTTRPNTGLLRQAKLQPLGVVDDATFRPQEFIGVVPVTSMNGRRPESRRPKSCSAPISLIEDDRTHQTTPLSSQVKTEKARKRSYSAVIPRNIPDETLQQLLSITRHTTRSKSQQEKSQDTLTTHRSVLEVSGEQTEFIKVEMKGLRKNSPRNFLKDKNQAKSEVKSSAPEQLPAIADTPRVAAEVGTRLKVTVTKTKKQQAGDHIEAEEDNEADTDKNLPKSKDTAPNTTSESETPKNTSLDQSHSPRVPSLPPSRPGQISNSPPALIAVGGARGVGPRNNRLRRLSGGSSGRLSQGWSPPQPIEPLKGSSVVLTHSSPSSSTTKTTKKGGVARTKLGEELEVRRQEQMVPSPTSSMTINVNVSEFLTTEHEPDETVT